MAQILDLGKIRFNWAGTYSASVQYEYNDLVKFGPNLYAFTSPAAQTGIDPTNTGTWTSVVEGIEWRSAYAVDTLYYKNDIVTDLVSTYICTEQHTATAADINNNTKFTLLALGQDSLPSQLNQVNKVLSSDGTDPFWTGTTYLTKGYWGSGQGQTASAIETSKELSNAITVFAGTSSEFLQFAFSNTSNAANASTDFIGYNDTGNNNSGFIDLGITSSGFADPTFTITGPNDGYLFMSGPRDVQHEVLLKKVLAGVATLTTSGAHNWVVGNVIRVEGVSQDLDGQHTITAVPAANQFSFSAAGIAPFVETDVDPVGTSYRPVGDGNLVIATDASGLTNAIVFAAGGYYSNNTQMAIYPDDKVHIEIDTESISPTTGALTVVGGIGVSGSISTSSTMYSGTGAKQFEVDASLTDTMALFKGATDSFAQVALVNTNNNPAASADIIVYSPAGTNDHGWIDMGYTSPAFDAETWGITGPGDGYIFVSGVADRTAGALTKTRVGSTVTITTAIPHKGFVGDTVVVVGDTELNGTYSITAVTETTLSFTLNGQAYSNESTSAALTIKGGAGNLVLATNGSGSENKIILAAGGLESGTEQLVISPNENVAIHIATESTSPSTGALTVDGGLGLQGNLNLIGTVTADGSAFFGDGAFAFATDAALTAASLVVNLNSDGADFAQLAIHNVENTASTDFIAYSADGNDTFGWMDMGVTGKNYNEALYSITGPNDAYIFYQAEENSGSLNNAKGNIVIATGDQGLENAIVFAAGGYASGNTQMKITPDHSVHIEIPTPSTDAFTGALTVKGGVGIQGDMNVAGNVKISGTIQFGGGGTTVQTENLAVESPMIFAGTGNLTDALDLGFIGEHAYPTTLDPSANVTLKSITTNVATLTVTYANGIEKFKKGDSVTVTGVDATFNGTYTLTAATATAPYTISYTKVHTDIAETNATTLTARNVTNKQLTSNVATLTTSGVHTFSVGEQVAVVGVDSTFNGSYTITAVPSTTSFSYAKTNADIPLAAATTSYPSTVTQKQLTGNVAILTTSSPHGYQIGENVVVSSVDSTFNGTFVITAVTASTFSYGKVAADVPATPASGAANVDRLVGTATATQFLGAANATDVFRPRYTGLVRDASDSVWKLFDIAFTKPSSTVNFAEAGVVYSTLKLKNIDAGVAQSSFKQITIADAPANATDTATKSYADMRPVITTTSTSMVARGGANTGHYFVIPAAGMVLTLPASPALGDHIRITDIATTATSTNFTIARNGQPIMGLAEDMVFNVSGNSINLVYSDSTRGWRLVN